jgi:hypothetical protein
LAEEGTGQFRGAQESRQFYRDGRGVADRFAGESKATSGRLLRNPKNAMRLMKAIEDIEARRNIVRHELIEE